MFARHCTPVALGLTLVSLCSCAAVPMPVLATAGVNVAEAGTSAFIRGSLEAVLPVPMHDVIIAANRMQEELEYSCNARLLDPTSYRMALTPKKGDVVVIRIDAHTPRVTRVQIKAGLLGDQALSRFMLEQIDARVTRSPHSQPGLDTSSPSHPDRVGIHHPDERSTLEHGFAARPHHPEE